MSELKEIAEKALKLSPLEKARLIEILYASYDIQGRKKIDEAWANEIEDRLDALDSGDIEAIPVEDVLDQFFPTK